MSDFIYCNPIAKQYAEFIDDPRLAQNLDEYLTKIFTLGGISAKLKGFRFLKDSIILVVFKPELMYKITKALYPSIASSYNVSPSIVERSIRTAVYNAVRSGKLEALNEYIDIPYFKKGYNVTNAEIISLLSERLRISNYR